jgi:acyl transferase domain-containing protein/acyl carrier protein/UDP-glucose 4-epimerase/SAM-dependent methyltransferase
MSNSFNLSYFGYDWENIDLLCQQNNGEIHDNILIFDVTHDLYQALKERAAQQKIDTHFTLVLPGNGFKKSADSIYEIDITSIADYKNLFQELMTEKAIPSDIIHHFSAGHFSSNTEEISMQLNNGIYSMLYLTKTLFELDCPKKQTLYYLYSTDSSAANPLFRAMSGFFKSVQKENPLYRYKIIEIQDESITGQEKAAVLAQQVFNEIIYSLGNETDIRLSGHFRFIKKLKLLPQAAENYESKIKNGGTYLITGGAGGIGVVLAEYLTKNYNADVVLCGRSASNSDKLAKAKQRYVYMQADITNENEAIELITAIKKRFGGINGVFHCAGIIQDSFLINKTQEQVKEVLAPKVYGTINLYEALKHTKTDFMVLFSSLASVLGNVGQSDYAYANSFLDSFAQLDHMYEKGHTVSVNWPLWESGGMKLSDNSIAFLSKNTGLEVLDDINGMKALEQCLVMGHIQCCITYGDTDLIAEYFEKNLSANVHGNPYSDMEDTTADILGRTVGFLIKVFAEVFKLDPNQVDPDRSFREYGVDSIIVEHFNLRMEELVGPMSKTLLFEHKTIHNLAAYMVSHYGSLMKQHIMPKKQIEVPAPRTDLTHRSWKSLVSLKNKKSIESGMHQIAAHASQIEDIAIIGMSFQLPEADNPRSFWESLQSGKSSIRQIPRDRWDYRDYYHPDPEKAREGKAYCRVGGFLNDVDKFDPLFFGIMPKDAEVMDPQERLFLEHSWRAVEDAGYTAKELSGFKGQAGQTSVGVFAAVTSNTYQFFGPEEWAKGNVVIPASLPWSIANRVSYVMDLHGPSIPVDTACSSGLAAIHLACESLKRGECGIAIAGGVNLYLHPMKYVSMCQMTMLSKTDRLSAFGSEADGFIPGEGVGVLILKPFQKAVEDKDHIYGVIKGSAINHGGNTNGYMVPNPVAQASLIYDALENAKVDARTISYIEAHGTGTILGDPIEISGLDSAFSKFTSDKQFCAIGSVKSNIGHLESAAGIASIIKVLLQMKHKKFVPSINAERLNPNIDFKSSPFFVQRTVSEWNQPAIIKDGTEVVYPRRAGVSSFGAGGANVHVVLEEYIEPVPEGRENAGAQIIVLSAKTPESLKQYAESLYTYLGKYDGYQESDNTKEKYIKQNLVLTLTAIMSQVLGIDAKNVSPSESLSEFGIGALEFETIMSDIAVKYGIDADSNFISDGQSIESIAGLLFENYKNNIIESESADPLPQQVQDVTLDEIAYTTQTGREPMQHRLAVVAMDICQLRAKLVDFLNGTIMEGLFSGTVDRRNQNKDEDAIPGILSEKIHPGMTLKELWTAARQWSQGARINWKLLYGDRKVKKVSLPTYPFARERYWIKQIPAPDYPAGLPASNLSRQGQDDLSSLVLYENIWVPSPLLSLSGYTGEEGVVLIFDTEEFVFHAFKSYQQISRETLTPILVKTAKGFAQTGNNTFELDPNNPQDYEKLFECLLTLKLIPNKIIFNLSKCEYFIGGALLKEGIDTGIYPVFHLCGSYMRQQFESDLILLYLYPLYEEIANPCFEAVSGFLETVRLENPRITCKSIGITSDVLNGQNHSLDLYNMLNSELRHFNEGETQIRYEKKCRYIKQSRELEAERTFSSSLPIRKGGVYLITGGAGGIGTQFADYLAKHYQAKLVLTGRSDLNENIKNQLANLIRNGAEAVYIQSDLSKQDQVLDLIKTIKNKFGCIHGLIHSAGIFSNDFIIKKQQEEFERVLAPKVYGTVYLDEALKNENLDFFVLFSSLAAVAGKVGQADYSFANCFLDQFAAFRDMLCHKGERSGKTLSINWPLWEEGGMTLSDEEQLMLSHTIGMERLPTEKGIAVFESGLMLKTHQCMVMFGLKERLETFLVNKQKNQSFSAAEDQRDTADKAESDSHEDDLSMLTENAEKLLKSLLSAEIGLSEHRIDSHTNFDEYGIDSIVINHFNSEIEKRLGPISKTLLFEYHNVYDLANYFVRNYTAALVKLFGAQNARCVNVRPQKQVNLLDQKSTPPESAGFAGNTPTAWENQIANEDIAIIGVSGRYPDSDNLQEFWELLKSGKDCITEIPEERWNYKDYFDPDHKNIKAGKMYCKWGGFIKDVDKFDPLFFNISPWEAEIMDPQERLLLQAAWEVLEDAGYTRKQLEELIGHERVANVGVFAAVTTHTYQFLSYERWQQGESAMVNPAIWSMANRISYVFNLQGPSMPVDTACSSGLTGIHLACESLKRGECKMAIVGGVNLYLHPSKYVAMSQVHMLSPTGRCCTFSDQANGMVPGEGVGAVLLKPLTQAVADHDHIYAVIKGSAVNHGGKTSGYSVPNPNAQANLILEALKHSKIDPRTISYVEAHGTGTILGDPVEITGLTKAFRHYTEDTQYCAVGSVKTNIGHLEAAAGFAGITKIILQLKNKMLVPSIHADKLNANIDFEQSPFYVQRELTKWNQTEVIENGAVIKYPRRAAVSAFGAGGANAHIILEEYTGTQEVQKQARSAHNSQIVVLSAKNQEGLKEYAEKVASFLESNRISPGISPVKRSSVINDILDQAQHFIQYGQLIDKQDVMYYHQMFFVLQDYARMAMLGLFRRIGVFHSPGESYDITGLSTKLGIIPEFSRLLSSILEMLSQAGFVHVAENRVSVLDKVEDAKVKQELASLEMTKDRLVQDYPDMSSQLKLLGVCLDSYQDILTGKKVSTDVLFPDGSMDLVENLYKGNRIIDYYNYLTAHTVRLFVEKRLETNPDGLINILEVGAGTGGTSTFVLEQLAPYQENIHYYYTDISLGFAQFGKRTYGDKYPFAEFRALDVEQSPQKQGFDYNFIDLVLATNVIHATRDICSTLNNVASLLKENGLFIVNEIIYKLDTSTLTFGLTKGWWLYQDEEMRIKNSPLLSAEKWKHCFEKSQFRHVSALGLPDMTIEQSRQCIIIGEYAPANSLAEETVIHVPLDDMAYTLQAGREAMDERLAIVTSDCEDLLVKLNAYISGEEAIGTVYLNNIKTSKMKHILEGDSCNDFIKILVSRHEFDKIASLWTSGASFDWMLLHENSDVRRISLPTYPFAKQRIWVPMSDQEALNTTISKSKQPQAALISDKTMDENMTNYYFCVPKWKLKTLPDSSLAAQSTEETGKSVLIISNNASATLAAAIRKLYQNNPVFEIVIGVKNQTLSETTIEIAADQLTHLNDHINKVENIGYIYCLNGITDDTFDPYDVSSLLAHEQTGIITLFQLVKALSAEALTERKLRIRIVTNDIHKVLPDEVNIPYSAGLSGFVRAMVKEYINWDLASIDISLKSITNQMDPESWETAAFHIKAEPAQKKGEETSIRTGLRYQRVLVPASVPIPNATLYKAGGVYVIAGGMGTIGYNLALYLSKTIKAKVVILGRGSLDDDKCKKLDVVASKGGKALYICADLSDYESLKSASQEIKSVFGTVNGVFHSAMVFEPNRIEHLTEVDLRNALASKTVGSLNLNRVFGSDSLDFIFFFSSGQSFTANAQRGHYAAGCNFQDAFAEYLDDNMPYTVKVINWGFWGAEGGSSEENSYNQFLLDQGVIAIYPDQGIQAINKVLAAPARQILFWGVENFVLDLMEIDRKSLTQYSTDKNESLAYALNAIETPELDQKSSQESNEAFVRFGQVILLDAFRRMGVFHTEGELYTVDELRQQLHIQPCYDRLFVALLDILKNAGFIETDGTSIKISPDITRQELITELEHISDTKQHLALVYPELKDYITLLWTCVSNYPDILRANVSATDIMFPGSSMELVEGIYKGNSTTQYFNELVVKSVLTYIKAKIPGQLQAEKINIIEIGAGTGGTSALVLDALMNAGFGGRVRYVYTDISKAFILHGKDNFGNQYPFTEFEVLNIEKNISQEDLGIYDIVIAANVLHATARIFDTISHIKSLLKINGWLIMNEATGILDFSTMTFGLLEGWWMFSDEEIRLKGSPLLSGHTWQTVLGLEGFRNIRFLGKSNIYGSKLFQSVILAESDGVYISKKPVTAEPLLSGLGPKNSLNTESINVKMLSARTARQEILHILCDVLKINEATVLSDVPFIDMGVDSILAVKIVNLINQRFGSNISATDFFDYVTVDKLAAYIENNYSESHTLLSSGNHQAQLKPARTSSITGEDLKKQVANIFSGILQLDTDSVDFQIPFMDYGVDSIIAARVVDRLNQALSIDLKTTDLFNYVTLSSLTNHIAERLHSMPSPLNRCFDNHMPGELPDDELLHVFRQLERKEINIEDVNKILREV